MEREAGRVLLHLVWGSDWRFWWGVVSEVGEVKASEKLCPTARELPLCPKGLRQRLQKPRCYAFHFTPPLRGWIPFSVPQPCKKTSLWQVGVRRDGRMTLETEGEHDKNRELFSCGHTRGGRADRKTQNSSQIHARAQPGLFFSLRILDNVPK